MTTPQDIKNWLRNSSFRTRDWYGQCAGLAYRIIEQNGGHVVRSYGSATEAYNDSRIESKDPSLAPPSAHHFWYYYGNDYRGVKGNWGHVTTDILGGGHTTLGATKNAREYWGIHAGLISVQEQTRGGMRYLGWSRTYGKNSITIELPAPAGNPSQDGPINTQGVNDVFIAKVKSGPIQGNFLVIPNGAGKPSAVGLAGNAGFSGLPTVDINQYHEAFWNSVALQ